MALSRRRSRAERHKQAEVIREALALARSASELMLPVARRRLDKEQRQGGLVVVLALYGEEAAVAEMAGEAPQRWAAATAAALEQPEQLVQQQSSQQHQHQQQQQQQEPSPAPGTGQQQAGPEAQQQQEREQPPGGEGGDDVPPAVADVTVAVQYMVDGSKVVFHKGEAQPPTRLARPCWAWALCARISHRAPLRLTWLCRVAVLACCGFHQTGTGSLALSIGCSLRWGSLVTGLGPSSVQPSSGCPSQAAVLSRAPAAPRCPPLPRMAGYPKSGLMGFCDPAPGSHKMLLVYFTFKVRCRRLLYHLPSCWQPPLLALQRRAPPCIPSRAARAAMPRCSPHVVLVSNMVASRAQFCLCNGGTLARPLSGRSDS